MVITISPFRMAAGIKPHEEKRRPKYQVDVSRRHSQPSFGAVRGSCSSAKSTAERTLRKSLSPASRHSLIAPLAAFLAAANIVSADMAGA
jgi:hypothetical protein